MANQIGKMANIKPKKVNLFFWLLTFEFLLLTSLAAPAVAVDRLRLRLGPFEQSVRVADLDRFAKTGELSAALKPFSFLLTSSVREAFSQRLQLDPNLTDKFIENWLRSPMSDQLLTALKRAIPDFSIEQIQAAIAVAARQANGITLIGILRSLPGETVTVDATEAIAVALQFNPSYWQSHALGPLLERELTVKSAQFHPSVDPATPGEERVIKKTLTFEDRQRDRTIPVDIYYSDNSTGSLVVMSHGFGADRTFLEYLARHLASHGIVVASIEHPGSNFTSVSRASVSGEPSSLIPPSEFIDRPKDVSFLLDELAKINERPGALQGKINTQKVTAIGHSLGGYTALALGGAEVNLDYLRQACKSMFAIDSNRSSGNSRNRENLSLNSPLLPSPGEWLQCAAAELPDRKLQLRDDRIAAAIALNPLIGQLFGPSRPSQGNSGLRKVVIPTMILASTEDAFTPAIAHQLQPFTQLGGTKYLLTAIGATHLSVGNPGNYGRNTLLRERIGEEAEPLRQVVKGTTLAFIKQLTPEAKNYEPFLTPAYAQSLSTSQLPLRLNAELPAIVFQWLNLAAVL
ncbi:alpha/beta hydrolase [Aerosakkonema funiforme]|uniref:alpha/beta hydrolase n=1 Tax=Aerosakkonema funiforme TaxID=1246630 RepID=UPI0035B6D54B